MKGKGIPDLWRPSPLFLLNTASMARSLSWAYSSACLFAYIFFYFAYNFFFRAYNSYTLPRAVLCPLLLLR